MSSSTTSTIAGRPEACAAGSAGARAAAMPGPGAPRTDKGTAGPPPGRDGGPGGDVPAPRSAGQRGDIAQATRGLDALGAEPLLARESEQMRRHGRAALGRAPPLGQDLAEGGVGGREPQRELE